MSLDLFAPAIAASDADVARNAAKDLPAEFPEALDMAWRSMTEWHNSTSGELARNNALNDYIDHVYTKTGERLPMPGLPSSEGALDAVTLDDFNSAQAAINAKNPTAMLQPLTPDGVSAMAQRKLAAVHREIEDFSQRETTWGGTAGTVLGTLAGGLTDPIAIATLPLGGAGEAGIAARALEFALISGGTEAATQASTYRAHEAAVPGSSQSIASDIGWATLAGGVLGAGVGLLGKLAKAGEKPLPATIREDLNAASSEAHMSAVNPFPTTAGETAARDVHVAATNDLLAGRAVSAADDFDSVHVGDFAAAAKAETPEALALAGERHLRPETIDDAPNVERFDAMPGETDDAASYWESRIAEASPEERAALGATDADVVRRRADDQMPEIVRVGPASFETTPISGKSLWHETSAENAARLLEEDMTNSVDRVRLANIFLADNRDIAIGQSGGGVKIEFNGDLVSAIEHGKPGTGDLTGREFKANALGNKSIESIEVAPGAKLEMRPSWDVRLNADFERSVLADGTVRYERRRPKETILPARDLPPAEMTRLAADPATESAVLHNFEHIMDANPEMEFTTQVRQPDGGYQFTTQKLSDVLGEIDGLETAAKEIEACAVGGALEAAE